MSIHTSMKIAADRQYDDMIYNTPMCITAAAAIFKKPVNKNDRPYDTEVIVHNNKLVDEWYETVLLNVADSMSSIPAGRVSSSFQYFIQGKDLEQHEIHKAYFPEYPEHKVKYWIDKFTDLSITEIARLGHGVVASGWNVIIMGIRYHFADVKWTHIYTETDPVLRDRTAHENPRIMNGTDMPFGLTIATLKDIEDKVVAVLKNPITPK